MRRLLAIAVPLAVLLGAPASAPAKEIVGAEVCGADGCRQISKPDHDLLGAGATTDPPSRAEPFVALRVTVGVPGHVERVRMLYLPRSERLLAGDGTTWLEPPTATTLRAAASQVTPFAAGKLPESVRLATSQAARAGKPLAPETFRVAADTPATANERGFDARWLAVGAATIVLAAGTALARRRRRDPPGAAAATG